MVEVYNELIIGLMKLMLLGMGFFFIVGIIIKFIALKW